MLLTEKIALVVGGGQTPGETIGNGRATAIEFAREGASVFVGDLDAESAQETVAMIEAEGGTAMAGFIDVTDEESVQAFVLAAIERWDRVDVLHNNVGMSIAAGDAEVTDIVTDDFDRLVNVNLRAMVLTCKHALPQMRKQASGVIINISSMAAWRPYPYVGYKTTKAGVIALTEQLAQANARYGIRANVILPGLMNTPMAIEGISRARRIPKQELIRARDQQVPLGGKMGTAWDTAYAALFLASDEARFITGAVLPVDGGQSARIG